MTAKQALLDYISGLTEEEAIDRLPHIIPPDPDFPPASPKVMELYRQALEDCDAGRVITDEEFGRRFNLD